MLQNINDTCILNYRIQELDKKLREKDGEIMERNNELDTLKKQYKE